MSTKTKLAAKNYPTLLTGIGVVLEQSRQAVARAVNCFMTATYWEIGRRIVEFEQGGKRRAEYGEELLERLSRDLTARHGRGFSRQNLQNMRQFYTAFGEAKIRQTLSGKSRALIRQTPSGEFKEPASKALVLRLRTMDETPFTLPELAEALPLPWSHYVLLITRAKSSEALDFYHAEALRGGWSVRQLDRQIGSLFYQRALLSKDKAAMLRKGAKPQPGDALTVDEALRDPLVLEFLNLRDEYSETALEDALVRHLETFLLELGGDFAFVGRQRRLRVGGVWYRVDLIFFHRRLRCLVVLDLKLGELTHADAGQMHLYLNYAGAHWTHPGENPPVGIILCSSADAALARYTLDTLPNKVMAREYRLALPAVKKLETELAAMRRRLERAGRMERAAKR